jgi:hypothetical protein
MPKSFLECLLDVSNLNGSLNLSDPTFLSTEFKVSAVSPALAILFAKPENRTLPWQ